MDVQLIRSWLTSKAVFSFSRSSGPGGQNVNKVNSKSTIRVDLAHIEGLSAEERLRLLDKLSSRLVGASLGPDGLFVAASELVIQVQDERSQLQNKELAIERAFKTIVKALHREKPRRATKPSRASQERRVASKKIVGSHKINRKRPNID